VRYRTIVADPPWRYRSTDILTRGWHRTASVETGKPHRSEGHYTTMTNAEIAALPVGDLAEKDAHVYMWVTNPRMFGERDGTMNPREIIEAWGFRYITLLTWVKQGAPGLGFYFRGNTEHVVFGIRGKAPIPPSLRESNTFVAPKGAHSRKPDCFLDLVERVSPAPRLEMFARRQRLGWDTWGNEALEHVDLGDVA
jgi:N6-adenosine-specific RNA methylase IME4